MVTGTLRWHLQRAGAGPTILLLHGTGAATHSWAGLLPLLAPDFDVVAPDLPGHGFTAMPPARGLSLPGMARSVEALLRGLQVHPDLVVGHSAGAAVGARMILDGAIEPRALVSLSGALLPLRGMPGHLFSPVAKLLAGTPLITRIFAWRAADPAFTEQLIRQTGSRLEPPAVRHYQRLVQSPRHVRAALRMMASWDLEALAKDLPRLDGRLVLVSCANDRTVPPEEARRVQARVPGATLEEVPGLGHLGHEEDPRRFDALLRSVAARVGVLPGT
jgi:magnesium chelatase accessory protein